LRNYENFKVCSNKVLFDEEGTRIRGYVQDKIVTSANKKDFLNRDRVRLGKNCFMFGDIINDARMTEKAGYRTEVRVGFRNTEHENFQEYLNKYDVVIEGDGSYVIPEFLMRVATNQTVDFALLAQVREICPELGHLLRREIRIPFG